VQLQADGHLVYAATGGRSHAAGAPLAVFVHGAGFDHTAWALESRWLAFHGWNVLALDLPAHGGSGGSALPSIEAMAEWLLTLLESVAVNRIALIGHSMGSLVALEAAAREARWARGSAGSRRIERLVLVGTAAAMPVHRDLLAAAQANDPAAIDMINLWGHGFRAGLGDSAAPGLWMVGLAARILERAAPGVLYADLCACNAYRGGLEAAAAIEAPTLLFCGEKDQMTPLKNARTLASALRSSTLVVARGAGHMLMAERPLELQAALAQHLAPPT
jgi:pimeloyl-ACP methyl ester carboxylesterase